MFVLSAKPARSKLQRLLPPAPVANHNQVGVSVPICNSFHEQLAPSVCVSNIYVWRAKCNVKLEVPSGKQLSEINTAHTIRSGFKSTIPAPITLRNELLGT